MSESLEQLQNDLRGLEELIEGRGWGVLKQIAEAQLKARENHVLYTAVGPEYSVEQEHMEKGELYGIRLFCTMPETAIEGLQHDIACLLRQQDTDEEEVNDGHENERNAP